MCCLWVALIEAAQVSEADRTRFEETKAKAEKGDAEAQYSLSGMYVTGEGVAKDGDESLKWLRKAAEQNVVRAQCNLGVLYSMGIYVEKNEAEALKWYRKAAEQDVAVAQRTLGAMYAAGEGVEKNEAEALKWFRKAAEQNDAWAQLTLGKKYGTGQGVEKDQAEALKWFRKAAEQNNAWAQYVLGLAYASGQGVEKDYIEGYAWFNVAARTDADAAKDRGIVENRMTPQQIAEAQKRTKELRALIEARSKGAPPSDSSFPLARAPELFPSTTGTGFFITDDGYLVTNQHVVGEGSSFRALTSGGLLSAKLVKVDEANDLAVLKVEGHFTALPVASSRAVKLGATVATVGFPNTGLQGYAPKLAKGEIASLSGAQDTARDFQISVPIQPGNSGGALVDTRGNVVGVVVAKLSARAALKATGELPENVNYAVKSSFLLGFLEALPQVAAKLEEPNTREVKFEEVVSAAEKAAVLVLVY